MTEIVVIIIIFAILAVALSYIIIEKRKGTKCIGCAQSKQCSSVSVRSKVGVDDIN